MGYEEEEEQPDGPWDRPPERCHERRTTPDDVDRSESPREDEGE
jgi:hypothetical protein